MKQTAYLSESESFLKVNCREINLLKKNYFMMFIMKNQFETCKCLIIMSCHDERAKK